LAGSTGTNARSLGSIANAVPPKLNETTEVVLHGTVNVDVPSNVDPGIC
jgi:hypothetical protein